jgi:hypothetical protein
VLIGGYLTKQIGHGFRSVAEPAVVIEEPRNVFVGDGSLSASRGDEELACPGLQSSPFEIREVAASPPPCTEV